MRVLEFNYTSIYETTQGRQSYTELCTILHILAIRGGKPGVSSCVWVDTHNPLTESQEPRPLLYQLNSLHLGQSQTTKSFNSKGLAKQVIKLVQVHNNTKNEEYLWWLTLTQRVYYVCSWLSHIKVCVEEWPTLIPSLRVAIELC